MKMLKIAGFLAIALSASVASAQKGTQSYPKPAPAAPPPPPVVVADPPPERLPQPAPKPTIRLPEGPKLYSFTEKPLGGRAMVLTREKAQSIIDTFKLQYAKLENPRLLIYVTRDIAAPAPVGADDPAALGRVQSLYGMPFTAAGVTLADPTAAVALLSGKPLEAIVGTDTPQARKEREVLSKIADVVIEVVVSSKTVIASGAEAQGITVPDLQSKAVRLSDSKVLGKASSTDLTNRIQPATLATYDIRELAEVAALALMDQM